MKNLVKFVIGILVLSLITIILINCKQDSIRDPIDYAHLVIKLQRGPCFGTCPIYKLTIKGNGDVTFEGGKYVKNAGEVHDKISREKIDLLLHEFKAVDYFSLKDNYTKVGVTDLPYVFTSITINGKSKEIAHYHGDSSAPKALSDLENKIDEIVGTDKWIGTVEERRRSL